MITREAETASAGEVFEVGSDDGASGQSFLSQVPGTGNGTGVGEDASLEFEIQQTGTHSLWARVWAPDGNGDAIYLGIDGEVTRVFPSVWGEYQWIEVSWYTLEPGLHRISIGRGEAGLRLDVLALTADSRIGSAELDAHLQLQTGAPAIDDPTTPAPPLADPAQPPVDTESGGDRSVLSVRGNSSFDPAELSTEARLWYDRIWAALDNPNQAVDAIKVSQSDDSYAFARTLFLQNNALILALRATGDLRFLDEIDKSAQNMRASLYDGWCGDVDSTLSMSSYGTIVEKDGYQNFRRRAGMDESHVSYCRDVADLEETLMHGHIAMLMNAYNENRDLPSPSGIDYGERADFWLDYLLNHFEAKWRERSDVQFPEMDFIYTKFCHTFNQFNMYYYFVGKALVENGNPDGTVYLDYARDMTDRMFETPYIAGDQPGGFVDTSTPIGPAVVYSFGAPGRDGSFGSTNMEACPSTYARYAVASQLELYFEGFHRWDSDIMTKIANGVAYFMMDTESVTSSSATFAAGVTGNKTVESIPPTEYRGRISIHKYAGTTMPALQLWDTSGKIDRLNDEIYDVLESDPDQPRRIFIPAAALMYAQLR